jgi:uncharacterized Zn ribbon protein
MSDLPKCPECGCGYTYQDGHLLVDGDHDIDCRIDGIGAMKLKSQFVKKA